VPNYNVIIIYGGIKLKLALVDGALGHTGSFLVRALIKNGWNVVATDLKKEDRETITTKEKVFSSDLEYLDCREWEGVTYISSDLTKKDTLNSLFSSDIFSRGKKNYDVIFHPASLYDYGASYDLLHLVNYEGLKNFLDVIIKHSEDSKTAIPRFIHWSTCGVYGQPLYQKDKKGYIYPTDETASFNPPNNYSQTKTEQEKLILTIAEDRPDFEYTIVRPAPIYGPYQTYGMYHIYYTMFKMGHFTLPKIFPKKRKLMMPMVHVEDLVNAAIFLAENDNAIGEAYNILSDSYLQEQWLEFLYGELGMTFTTIAFPWILYKLFSKTLLKLANLKERKAIKYGIRPQFDVSMIRYITHQYYFSNQKIKDLGFEFKYKDFEKGTSETIDWYKRNGWFFTERDWKIPQHVNIESKPAITSKEEYKTPMEGGVAF
jgi:nucleoside-diphosphate-sugar epimerase